MAPNAYLDTVMTSRRQDFNLGSVLLDEVALEGLDGVTLPALATRLLTVPSPCAIFRGAEDATPAGPLLQMCWDVIRSKAGKGINIYQLQQDREELVVFNR